MKLAVEEVETPADPIGDAKAWAKEVENPLLKFTNKQLVDELVSRAAFLCISGVLRNGDNAEPVRIMHGDLMNLYAHVGTMFDGIKARMTAMTMGPPPQSKIVRPK